MKVILLENIKKLGEKNSVINVKDGYAMNFLIPQGLAVTATNEQMMQLEKEKQSLQAKEQKTQNEVDKLISKIKDKKIIIKKQASEKGKLFAAVTVDEILAAIKKSLGAELNEEDVQIKEHIKDVGKHKINIVVRGKRVEIVVEVMKN